MSSAELRRWLAKQGCTFDSHAGGSGHVTARVNGRRAEVPMHGSRKELGKGLVHSIKKDLGLS